MASAFVGVVGPTSRQFVCGGDDGRQLLGFAGRRASTASALGMAEDDSELPVSSLGDQSTAVFTLLFLVYCRYGLPAISTNVS